MHELYQGDGESRDADAVSDEDAGEELIEPYLEISERILEVGFGDEG
jgi:hypothetical protein